MAKKEKLISSVIGAFMVTVSVHADVGQTYEIQHLQRLTEEPNSVKFCLSALINLDLCCSSHWVKRLSLDFIPEWYNQAGLFQIGNSHVPMSGALCPTQACCFIQPFCKRDIHFKQYHLTTVISLLLESQLKPIVITSRGPPLS